MSTRDYVEDYFAGRREKLRASKGFYDMSLPVTDFVRNANHPEQVNSFFAADLDAQILSTDQIRDTISKYGTMDLSPTLTDEQIREMEPMARKYLQDNQSDFLVRFEDAFYRSRMEGPEDLEWLNQFDIDDLELLTSLSAEDPEIIQLLRDREEYMAASMEWDAEFERQVQARMEAESRWDFLKSNSFSPFGIFMNKSGLIDPGPDTARADAEEWVRNQLSGKLDKNREDEIAKFMERMRKDRYELGLKEGLWHKDTWTDENEEAMTKWLNVVEASVRERLNLGEDPAQTLNADKVSMRAINRLGEYMTSFAEQLDVIDPALSPRDPFQATLWATREIMREKSKMDQAEILAAAEEDLGLLNDKEAVRKANLYGMVNSWKLMEAEQDPYYQEMLQMAGYDPTLAFQWFMDMVSNSKEYEAELTEVNRKQIEAQQDLIDSLEDQDYRLSNALLDAMAVYGKHVPGRLATYATLAISDKDIHEAFGSGEFSRVRRMLAEGAVEADYTPSKALGVDGSFAGLMFDLGAGIAFDPTTWIFGPRGASALGITTTKEAAQVATSGAVRAIGRDILKFYRSPSRGRAAVTFLMGDMPDAARFRFERAFGWVDNTLPNRPWSTNGQFLHAVEVQTGKLDMLPTAAMKSDDVVPWMLAEIKKTGFEEPIVVGVDSSGAMGILDGNKRLLAARQGEISAVPVVLRKVDTLPNEVGSVAIESLLDAGDELFVDLEKLEPGDLKIDKVLPRYSLYGEISQEQMDTLLRQALEDGWNPASYNNIGLLRGIRGRMADMLEAGQFRKMLDRNTQPMMLSNSFDVASSTGLRRVEKMVHMLAGEHTDFADLWLGRLVDLQNKVGQRLEGFFSQSKMGKVYDDVLEEIDTMLNGTYEGIDELADDLVTGKGRYVFHGTSKSGAEGIEASGFTIGGLSNRVERSLNYARDADLRGLGADEGLLVYEVDSLPSELRDYIRGTGVESDPYRWEAQFAEDYWTRPHWDDDLGDWVMEPNDVFIDDVINRRDAGELFDIEQARAADDYVGSQNQNPWSGDSDEFFHQADFPQPAYVLKGDEVRKLRDSIEYATQRRENIAQLEKVRDGFRTSRDAHLAQMMEETPRLLEMREINTLINDMWNDFNSRYINTNPGWKNLERKVVELSDGREVTIVPWEDITPGHKLGESRRLAEQHRRIHSTLDSFNTPEIQNILKDDKLLGRLADMFGIKDVKDLTPSKLFDELFTVFEDVVNASVPVAPLELVAASTISGAAYRRLTHIAMVDGLRNTLNSFNTWWIIDKVARPATAAVVSWDELMRIFHVYGNEAVLQWMKDRSIMAEARVKGWGSKNRGYKSLNPAKQERLQSLRNYPQRYKQGERLFTDRYGSGWTDLDKSTPGYADASRRYLGGLVQDSGFRAWLRGRKDFTEWFNSADGQHARESIVLNRASKTMQLGASADDLYDGITTIYDIITSRVEDKVGVRKAFQETAEKAAASNTPIDLPDWVYREDFLIRGMSKTSNKLPVAKYTDKFFDHMFLDPVNYRRGLLANLVRSKEKSRLISLYTSRKMRVVKNAELEDVLGLRGINDSTRLGMKPFIQRELRLRGMVAESEIDDMVELAVEAEIDNMLYVFDEGSRAGQNPAMRAAFPFGKPWADMWGFWSRETMRKSSMRKVLGGKQVRSPINRTTAMMSRLAHTDFDITRGWMPEFETDDEGHRVASDEGEGLLPGSTSSSFAPLFFLPTGGDNPFGAVIPGLGWLPILFLDWAVQNKYDPVDQPLQYQQLVDEVGDFIPSAHFASTHWAWDLTSRVFGGGVRSTGIETAMSVGELFGVDPLYEVSRALGDPVREIESSRSLGAIMADPDNWNKLMGVDSQEEFEDVLSGMTEDAYRVAGTGNALGTGMRFLLPMNSSYSDAAFDLQDVWVEAGNNFKDTLGYGLELKPKTADERRKTAGKVRDRFFDLPQWERDMMIAKYPQLAVNLIGGWEWTNAARTAGEKGVDLPYRTDGSKEGLARHESLISEGFIAPVSPYDRARRIMGLARDAQVKTAKYIYEKEAEGYNNYLWESNVSDKTKAKLEEIAASDWGKSIGFTDAHHVWREWGSYEDDFSAYLQTLGYSEKDSDAYARISSDERPWSSRWIGYDNLPSERMQKVTFNWFSPEALQAADALGIDLEAGATGLQLASTLQNYIDSSTNVAFNMADYAYNLYVDERGSAYRTAEAQLKRLTYGDDVSPEYQQRAWEFMSWASEIKERYEASTLQGGIPAQYQREAQERYSALKVAADQANTPFERVWKVMYERSFGPLNWEPPTPPQLRDDRGRLDTKAERVVNFSLVDGDSLYVEQADGRWKEIRLLGVRARDYSNDPEGAALDTERLRRALSDKTSRVYLMRQPEKYGNVDMYGRQLSWLFIDGVPFYFEEEMIPNRDK